MNSGIRTFFIIDFDSTFTKVEALDELCLISLNGHPDKEIILTKIKAITDLGMNGELSLRESLSQRIKLLQARKEHLPILINRLKTQVSDSFKANKAFLKNRNEHIYIISNGFAEFIVPVVADYGIKPEHVLANTFVYDDDGNIVDFNKNNVLSEDKGKVKKVKELGLTGTIVVIGDGYTDFEIKEAGLADLFFAFTENVTREKVTMKADYVVKSLDEILKIIQ